MLLRNLISKEIRHRNTAKEIDGPFRKSLLFVGLEPTHRPAITHFTAPEPLPPPRHHAPALCQSVCSK